MYYRQDARLAIYCQGELGKTSKTAEGMMRYGKNPIVAVVDNSQAGKALKDVVGIDCPAPIVSTIDEALSYKPDALLLGTAWRDGILNPAWRPDILQAINNGLDVINGLHDFLCDDPEIARMAELKKVRLLDVRKPPEKLVCATGKVLSVPAFVVLTVGSDGSIGKMTTTLELLKSAEKKKRKAAFIATGQTGIMIAGAGIAIDRVIGDFMAGATEQMILEAAAGQEFILVEGQGSLIHPGWSGVTLGLLHGACPHAMILVHNPRRKTLRGLPDFPIPDYARLIHIYEDNARAVRESKVVAVALNTMGMSEDEAKAAIAEAEKESKLPATDPVRYGADKLFDAVLEYQKIRQANGTAGATNKGTAGEQGSKGTAGEQMQKERSR